MTKGERLVAEMMGDIPAYGYPVLTEQHSFPSEGDCLYEVKSRVERTGNGTAMGTAGYLYPAQYRCEAAP